MQNPCREIYLPYQQELETYRIIGDYLKQTVARYLRFYKPLLFYHQQPGYLSFIVSGSYYRVDVRVRSDDADFEIVRLGDFHGVVVRWYIDLKGPRLRRRCLLALRQQIVALK